MSTEASRQRQILADMGIDVWLLRENPAAVDQASISSVATESTGNAVTDLTDGISSPKCSPQQDVDVHGDAETVFASLQEEVMNCQRCGLSKSRTQTVFGTGTSLSGLLLIGEAPGAEEDRLGKPFVGKAGKLLDAMLFAIGFDRSQVFICNVLKCRPPNNRDPRSEEVDACSSYLNCPDRYCKTKSHSGTRTVRCTQLVTNRGPGL